MWVGGLEAERGERGNWGFGGGGRNGRGKGYIRRDRLRDWHSLIQAADPIIQHEG